MGQTITGDISAQSKLYSAEYIEGYERGDSLLRSTVTTETMKNGSSFQFVIEDSGDATAVTRGLDGSIVPRSMNNNTVSLNLSEFNDLPRMTGFNIFSHQASSQQRMAMYRTSYKTISRTVDDQILAALRTATTGPNNTSTDNALKLLTDGVSILGSNNVPVDNGELYAVVSPAFITSLQGYDEFSNADYVSMKKWDDGVVSNKKMYDWNGIKIFCNTGIEGLGTSDEYCFLYHKTAIGHAIDKGNFDVVMGYNEEQNYSFVRCSTYTGAALLQNEGVAVLKFVGNAASAVTIT